MNHIFIIWLGQAIGAAALSVLQAATVGSMSLVNLVFDSSQGTPAIYVGSQQVLQPSAGGLVFPNNGTQSGAVIKTSLGIAEGIYDIPCTNSGGNANYDSCTLKNPVGQSGAITELSFGCSAPKRQFTMSGSFVKALRTSATSTSLVNFNTKTFGTGSFVYLLSGAIKWNRDDFLKFQVGTTAVDATYDLTTCRGHVNVYNPNIR